MAQCSCGAKATFKGYYKPKGEYLFECTSCNNQKWIPKIDLTPEDQKIIDEVIASRRSKSNLSSLMESKEKNYPVQVIRNLEDNISPQDFKLYSLKIELNNVFKNILPYKKPGYSFRPGQIELSQKFIEVLHCGEIILSEAGVGTGKTYAYCIPSLILIKNKYLSSGSVIISTKTISLQEQLEQDLNDLIKLMGISPKIPVC